MTTHSPLFVLGMTRLFGDDGFDAYDLPSGSRLEAELFDEFGEAFRAFKDTTKFSNEIRTQIANAQQPFLYLEGETDCRYIRKAAEVLGKMDVLAEFTVKAAGGQKRLTTIWKALTGAPQETTKSVLLLYDPECSQQANSKNGIHKRTLPFIDDHPISKGIENYFGRDTLDRARRHNGKFIDIVQAHTKTERGEQISISETWTVNDDEKGNLCDWLCANGTAEDFQSFEYAFEILQSVMSCLQETSLDKHEQASE